MLGDFLPSASRTKKTNTSRPSDESLGYFRSSATRTEKHPMDNDHIQALIGIVIGLIAVALLLTPVVALWVYIILQNGKRKRIRERILAARADMIGNKRWFPARYASQDRFDSWFKILPWEGAGIFIVTPGSVLFLGEMFSGAPVTLQFAPGNSRVAWLGKCPWPNGAVSWLRFDTADQKHYFSSETGVLIFGSHGSTKAIYDEADKNFGSPAAQNW
ncbi:MAG TPA: hypothetical protein VHD88_03030 [Pyrinomonadaceae bacterium]|nr:hypothetical protein [Pyrinomonadaceae bacterium]